MRFCDFRTAQFTARLSLLSHSEPSIFAFYLPSAFTRYHASQLAIELFGHDPIIACIELAKEHETDRIRDSSADAFPMSGVAQQLIIIRSRHQSVILALAESEVWFAELWLHRNEVDANVD